MHRRCHCALPSTDHYADLPYMYSFRAFSGDFDPLRVYGPSGRTPELGTKHMVKHMREMNRWREENFNACPIGDGFEIDVHEFDWKLRNGMVYDQDGVKVRSWSREAALSDGAAPVAMDPRKMLEARSIQVDKPTPG